MAILTRIFRLFKADIHGVMDQIEDQGLLLKQHLRDMEESLVQKEAKLKQMCFARDQAQQDYEKGIKESNNLEQDLEVAIRKDRDDIARMLIKKLKPLTHIQYGHTQGSCGQCPGASCEQSRQQGDAAEWRWPEFPGRQLLRHDQATAQDRRFIGRRKFLEVPRTAHRRPRNAQ